LTGNLF
jgi:hypothetical protein